MSKSFEVRVEHIRDGLLEELHIGEWANSWSESGNNIYYLRSCAKPLQATLLIDYDIEISDEELAFCCGSHAGEECHINIARNLLKKFNLKESDLKCGIHAPLSRSMQDKMLLQGGKASQIHNNCSGKHIGFLSICKKMGWDLTDYDKPEHPLQIAVKNKINSICEVTQDYPVTTDGCGVPILSMPLKNLLKGYVNLSNYPRIIKAIKNNPYIFGGENRSDTQIIKKTDNIIAKVGAGGLCVVLNYALNKAFAVKINDCSMEAREIVVFEILNKLNWANIKYDNTIKTLHGKTVGKKVIKICI